MPSRNEHDKKEPHATPPETLAEIAEHAWDELVGAVRDRHHGFHLPTLATVNPDGSPEARIVVLRAVDRGARSVACHTDARSPKAEQIDARPSSAWVFYDPARRLQIRALGLTVLEDVETSEAAKAAWTRTDPSARRCYLGPNAPSQTATEPTANLPAAFERTLPSEEQSAPGTANFRRVVTTVTSLDWLHLRHDGHRRALFTWDASGEMRSTWLEP